MSEQGGTTAKTKDAESGKIKPGTTAAAPSTITIHNETPTEMSFTKEWRKNGFPLAWQEPITVTLNAYADNPDEDVTEDASYTLSPESHEGWTAAANNDGSVTFTISGLRAFDDNGNALTYYVQEADIPGYTTTYADGQGMDGGDRALNGQTIINTAYIDVQVVKRNYTTQATMTGAEFRLDRKTENGWKEGTAAAVGNDGTLVFEGLADGEYRIAETKAPAGYIPLASPIRFTIEDGVVSYTGNGALVSYTAATADAPATFTVDNRPGVALPSTGGGGTAPYIVTGIALMALAGILLLDRKRKAHK